MLTVCRAGFPDMLIYRAATGIGEAMQLTVLLAIAANYFIRHRAAALGAMNFSFGHWRHRRSRFWAARCWPRLGAGGCRWSSSEFSASWRWRWSRSACDPWFTEARQCSGRASRRRSRDALNRNTILLTVMSLIGGLVIYGYLGMYPTFLRESLEYSPTAAGSVMSLYGLGNAWRRSPADGSAIASRHGSC